MRVIFLNILVGVMLSVGTVFPAVADQFDDGISAYESNDYATALRHWRPLAERGHAGAEYALGYLYYNGMGVTKDFAEALKWYRKAADHSHSGAQSVLGIMYQYGQGVATDLAEAAKWYRKAAEQGNVDAQSNLGSLYHYGNGVTEDLAEALKWYRKAAEQGVADASKEVEKIQKKMADREATEILIREAEQGDTDAQYRAAVIFNNGDGVEENLSSALSWALRASDKGHEKASVLYGELLLKDFVYGSDVRALEDLALSLKTSCKRDIKCAFDRVWGYLDHSDDGFLSLAEIARFQRNIVKYATVKNEKKKFATEEIVAINLGSIIFLPITASSILHSFDYNNDGLLSKGEVFGETEFSKLIGLDVQNVTSGIDFRQLGNRLSKTLDLLPFSK